LWMGSLDEQAACCQGVVTYSMLDVRP